MRFILLAVERYLRRAVAALAAVPSPLGVAVVASPSPRALRLPPDRRSRTVQVTTRGW